MSLPSGFRVVSKPAALPEGFKVVSPNSAAMESIKENARMLGTAVVKIADAIPDAGNAVLSGLSWLGGKLGVGDGTYTPAEKFSELEPEWMKPQTEWGDTASTVGSVLLSAPDAPLVAGRVAKRGAEVLAEKALPAANKELMDIAKRLGFKPTVAVVTQSAPAKITEQVLANTPFSAGVTRQAIADEHEGLAAAFGEMAGESPDSSQLGYDIQEQVKDSIQAIKSDVSDMYDRAFRGISGESKVPVSASQKQLKAIASKYKDDPALNVLFGSKTAAKLAGQKDMTLSGLRNLRSQTGQAIAEGNVKALKDLSDGELKQLYGSLSEDIKSALRSKKPSAAKLWEEADRAYALSMERQQMMTGKFLTGKDATGAYNAIFGASDKGFKTLSKETAESLRDTLSPEVWDDVKREFLRRMGKSTAANGGEFSPSAFATNWDRVEDAIKSEVFTPGELSDLEDIATYSKAVKEMEKSRNYSNTAHVGAMASLPTSMFLAPVTTATTIAGAAALSRVMASGKMLDWLAALVANGELTPDLAKGLELIIKESMPARMMLATEIAAGEKKDN
ncbi:hypothetical protein DMH99_10085 [Salmonella enterica]|nr:hypothetical protein [Salmonella enterica]